jgi:redox-regulated HSP33 family molecular chaperone
MVKLMYPRWSYEGIIVEGRFETETHTIRQGTKYIIYRKESEEKTFIELLKNSNPDVLQEMADENGIITADCQFCKNKYQFFVKDL